jgi:3-oxoacyl-[acyl-carrier-protein] synthase II
MGGVTSFASDAISLYENKYRTISPYTVPRALVNMAAGWISLQHGFTVR